MNDLEEIILPGENVPRKMGRLPPNEATLKMRAGMQSFSDYLLSKGIDIKKEYPRNKWKPTNHRASMGNEFINNQGQYGACVGYSAAQANMRLRAMRGLSFQKLSGAYIYDQINGGQDNGAIITQSLNVLRDKGTCLESEYSHPVFNTRNQPASRNRFKLAKAFTITSFFEMAVALQMGFPVQYPIQVGRNYNQFDSDGCCGVDQGQGNHSVEAYDLECLTSGEFVLRNGGTWDMWGPWKNGCAYHKERAIESCAVQDDAYVHIDELTDSQDDNPPETLT